MTTSIAKTKKSAKATKAVEEKKVSKKKNGYLATIGRRKTSAARVRISEQGEKVFTVNGKPCFSYFPTLDLQQIVSAPLEKTECQNRFNIEVRVVGGGFHSQAEAVRHGLTRALVLFDPEFRNDLKKFGFLTRDSRMRERKKFGLKRARKAPQWAKR
jgi:small subunit ribosomal protein S9